MDRAHGFLFDLDGTLVDSVYQHVLAWRIALDRAGIEPAKVGSVGPRSLPWVIGAPDWLFNNIFLKKWKIDAKARSSMADDLAAGRRTEVDYINGELVSLAERLGTTAPINRRIVELIRRAEAGAPPWSPPDLRRELFGR